MESMDMEDRLYLEDNSEKNVKDKEFMRKISTEAMQKCLMDAYKGQRQTKRNIFWCWGGRQVGDIMQIHFVELGNWLDLGDRKWKDIYSFIQKYIYKSIAM